MSVGCPVYWVALKRFPLVWTAGNGLKDPPNWFISYWIHPQPGHGPTDSKKCPEKFFYWIHYTLYSGQPTPKMTKSALERLTLSLPNFGSRCPFEVIKKRKLIRIEFPKFLAWFQTHQTSFSGSADAF